MQFQDLLGRIFEHEGMFWRVTKVGTPGGYTWTTRLWFEPAEYQTDEDQPGFKEMK